MRTSILMATILVPATASAGGYLVPNLTPRDLALGGSAVAEESGAGAWFSNTAALAGPDGLDIDIAGGFTHNGTSWEDASFGENGKASVSENALPPTAAVSIGGRLPQGQAWGIGAGFLVPAGGTLDWKKPDGTPDWAGQESIRSVKQQIFGFGGGAAFQLLPSLKLGVHYIRYEGTEEVHQSLNYIDHFGDAGIGIAGGANSFGVAGEFHVPNLPLSVGVAYERQATMTMSGHIHFTSVPPGFQAQLHDQAVKEDILVPDVLRAGVAYEVIPNLKVMASYQFENWSDYAADVFIGADGFMATVARNYKNAHVIGVAGEWSKLVPQLTARAGIVRSISDQPANTLSPSLTDASKWGLSAGVGYDLMPALRVDLGAQVMLYDKVTASGMTDTGVQPFPGSYSTTVFFASLGVNWRTDLGLSRL
jgi:long-chain fatty acid transport protein